MFHLSCGLKMYYFKITCICVWYVHRNASVCGGRGTGVTGVLAAWQECWGSNLGAPWDPHMLPNRWAISPAPLHLILTKNFSRLFIFVLFLLSKYGGLIGMGTEWETINFLLCQIFWFGLSIKMGEHNINEIKQHTIATCKCVCVCACVCLCVCEADCRQELLLK